MVPKWQHAFSQVLADGRFAVLGVVLMAVLGEVCAVVGITAELEELGQVEVEKVLEEFGREEWTEDGGEMKGVVGEDRGEVVQRVEEGEDGGLDSVAGVERGNETTMKHMETSKETRATSKKRHSDAPEKKSKKKRKKTGNAIDDIFG